MRLGHSARTGGGCEIRTREGLPPTRFPSVRPRPLGESSAGKLIDSQLCTHQQRCVGVRCRLLAGRTAGPSQDRQHALCSFKLGLWSSSGSGMGAPTLTMPVPGVSGLRYRPGQSGLISSLRRRTCSTCTPCSQPTRPFTGTCSRTSSAGAASCTWRMACTVHCGPRFSSGQYCMSGCWNWTGRDRQSPPATAMSLPVTNDASAKSAGWAWSCLSRQ
jgi:hypothetical protein